MSWLLLHRQAVEPGAEIRDWQIHRIENESRLWEYATHYVRDGHEVCVARVLHESDANGSGPPQFVGGRS